MKYDYYCDHWGVEVTEKKLPDGSPVLINVYYFNTEEEAVNCAKEHRNQGKPVAIKAVHWMEGWE